MADPSLAEAIEQHRASVESLDAAARRRLRATYRSGYRGIIGELSAIQSALRTAPRIPIIRGDGSTTTGVPPSWLFQEARYLDLQTHVRGVVRDLGNATIDETMQARAQAYRAGVADTRRAALSMIGEIAPSAWAPVPTRAVESFLGASGSGPLARLVSGFVTETGAAAEILFRDTLAEGLLSGRSLFAVGRDLDAGFSTLSLSRATTIARTETLRAYREGSFQAMQANRKHVRTWVWRAGVDSGTAPCAACFARHGTEWPLEAQGDDEPAAMQTHPNCRCIMVPQRNDFMGIRPSGPGTTIEPLGRAAFDRLPLDMQRSILGPTRLGMYQRGEVAFSDFAGVRSGGAWGANRAAITPLRDLRSVASQTRTIRRSAEDRILRDIGAEPTISRALTELEAQFPNANLAGYNYRVKTFESTARKVGKEIDESQIPLTPQAAADGLKDTLRYTYEIPEGAYATDALAIRSSLEAAGYERIKWASTWEQAGYKGLNTAWREPTTGRVFELQFHTPLSLHVKETISHPLYEVQRKLVEGSADWLRIQRELDEAWGSVTVPHGIERLGG